MEIVFWLLAGLLLCLAWRLVAGEIRYEHQMRKEIEALESFHAEISQ